MNKWGKLAASTIALLALAGCSSVSPAPAVTVTATVAPSPTPTPSAAVEGPIITGNIQADVLAAGYDPDNMDSAIDWVDKWLCDASHEDVLGDTEFDRHVRTSGGTKDGRIHPYAMQVIVYYKCPQLSEVLAASIIDAKPWWD